MCTTTLRTRWPANLCWSRPTSWVSERWSPDALFPYRAVLRSLSSIRLCRERSGTLSNSFRFGKPTADGIEAVVEFVGSPYMIRDALIVNPPPGQANSGIRALAYPSDETDWTLEISSDVALRYVSIDAPGWIPSDNFFHLVAATPYSVRLQRCCDQAAPLGKVASVDSRGTATITASA